MAEHFINLNCANCGAKLDVYGDMERFACGYCGTEMVVQRRGGTVMLKPLTEAIRKVQTGTDKTAAELALVRLRSERGGLVKQFTAGKHMDMPWGCAVVAAAVVVGLGVWIMSGLWLIGLPLVVVGAMVPLMTASGRRARTSFDSKIASLDQEIARQTEIVSGPGSGTAP